MVNALGCDLFLIVVHMIHLERGVFDLLSRIEGNRGCWVWLLKLKTWRFDVED